MGRIPFLKEHVVRRLSIIEHFPKQSELSGFVQVYQGLLKPETRVEVG